ncbi:MAG TPA: disulfide oxidoreductase [Roseiflexaceae bacterium]|nr:disulfide oxidoreductase [Roseiflexaceae bacterium]HMP39905.1 disulfide oxidoreductase [Roseiflexaceae bacterium]
MSQQILTEQAPDASPGLLAQIIAAPVRAGRHIALLAAWIATCGSLFFSEVLGWIPCELCWYQRILMYPLALLIAVGILRRDHALHWYVLPLSLFGGSISLYHYLLIKTDWFIPPRCTGGIPCNVDYIDIFGFINIPFLALVAFVIISFAVSAPALLLDEPEQAPPLHRDWSRMAVLPIIGLVIAGFFLLV